MVGNCLQTLYNGERARVCVSVCVFVCAHVSPRINTNAGDAFNAVIRVIHSTATR